MNDPAIDKLYETCRYHLFQIEHARADFRNEFRIKSNIINEETEENLIQIIRDRENNKDNKHVLV